MVRLSWNDGMYCGELTDIIQPLFAMGMKIPKSISPPLCCALAAYLAMCAVSGLAVPRGIIIIAGTLKCRRGIAQDEQRRTPPLFEAAESIRSLMTAVIKDL